MVPLAGLEPARITPLDFESSASANFATAAYNLCPIVIITRIIILDKGIKYLL